MANIVLFVLTVGVLLVCWLGYKLLRWSESSGLESGHRSSGISSGRARKGFGEPFASSVTGSATPPDEPIPELRMIRERNARNREARRQQAEAERKRRCTLPDDAGEYF